MIGKLIEALAGLALMAGVFAVLLLAADVAVTG